MLGIATAFGVPTEQFNFPPPAPFFKFARGKRKMSLLFLLPNVFLLVFLLGGRAVFLYRQTVGGCQLFAGLAIWFVNDVSTGRVVVVVRSESVVERRLESLTRMTVDI